MVLWRDRAFATARSGRSTGLPDVPKSPLIGAACCHANCLAGRANACRRSGIRLGEKRMGIAQHNQSSPLPEAGTIGLFPC